MSKASDTRSRKTWRGVGYVFQAIGFILGIYGLVLWFSLFDNLRYTTLKLCNASDFGLAGTASGSFADVSIFLRFIFFIVAVGLFAFILAAMVREIRRLQRTVSAIVSAASMYVFAGVVFLAALVFNVQWMVEVHLVGRIMISVAMMVALYLIVVAGVKTERSRFILALLFAVIAVPAQFILLLPVFQFVPTTWWVILIALVAALGVNLLIFTASMKRKKTQSAG
ncbi:hypothetical protein GF359_10670 [candidate division WOR-3 bacterium]|uniref:DUF998 domain-containing protein n=1 Tax=candidate division WOR-3 bacterium TaxID=2052148 RepID=A0A9D5KBE5_UNCW3|nr:hypothetical protein [candidate division WOR-3 bacterium]MBD3365664.1 hypothetical protein [candidate division WOR-3 bacterium]